MPKKKNSKNLMLQMAEAYMKAYEDRNGRSVSIGNRDCLPRTVVTAWRILIETSYHSNYGDDGWNPIQEDRFAAEFGRENVGYAEVVAEGFRDFMMEQAKEV